VLEPGDLICSELGPKWAGYQAQISQCISLGKPSATLLDLHKYACEMFHRMADRVRPGVHHDEVLQAAGEVVERCRANYGDLADGFNPIATPAGLGGPDPEPTSKILEPNQAFNLHIGHGVSQPQHLYGGYCVVVTDGAPRHLSRFPIEELMLKVID
jgi:Xaa-Pro aminopeptidase